MEMTVRLERWKSKPRFPTFPPPLGNLARRGEIPTFPPFDCWFLKKIKNP